MKEGTDEPLDSTCVWVEPVPVVWDEKTKIDCRIIRSRARLSFVSTQVMLINAIVQVQGDIDNLFTSWTHRCLPVAWEH
jgi:hypothetical protein